MLFIFKKQQQKKRCNLENYLGFFYQFFGQKGLTPMISQKVFNCSSDMFANCFALLFLLLSEAGTPLGSREILGFIVWYVPSFCYIRICLLLG